MQGFCCRRVLFNKVLTNILFGDMIVNKLIQTDEAEIKIRYAFTESFGC
jgi:hypothetical protein